MRAHLHKGLTWWLIPEGATGFNAMRNGFRSEVEARTEADRLGWIIIGDS